MRIVVISSVAKRKKGGTHKTVKCDKSQKKSRPNKISPLNNPRRSCVCPSVCVKTDTQRNKKKKDNHRSPCPTVKTRKGTKILTETRREVPPPPPCGLLSVTQEEFFQFDFFFRPRLLLAAAHSIRWGLLLLLLPCYYNNPTGSKRGRRLLLFKAQGTGAAAEGVAGEGNLSKNIFITTSTLLLHPLAQLQDGHFEWLIPLQKRPIL